MMTFILIRVISGRTRNWGETAQFLGIQLGLLVELSSLVIPQMILASFTALTKKNPGSIKFWPRIFPDWPLFSHNGVGPPANLGMDSKTIHLSSFSFLKLGKISKTSLEK